MQTEMIAEANDGESSTKEEIQTDEGKPEQFSSMTIIDATVVLGALTAWAYVWSYFREFGNKQYYGLSNTFMELDVTTIFKSIGETWIQVVVATFFAILTQYILRFLNYKWLDISWGKIRNYMRSSFINIIPLLITIIPISFFKGITQSVIISILIGILTPICVISYRVLNRLSDKVILFLVIFSLSLVASYWIGEAQAQEEEGYLVVERPIKDIFIDPMTDEKIERLVNVPYVVIDTLGENIIIAGINESTRQLTTNFVIVEQKSIEMKFKKAGPLRRLEE